MGPKRANAAKGGKETSAGAVIKRVKRKVAEVVDNAGDMLIDDVADEPAKEKKARPSKDAGIKAALKKAGAKVAEVVENAGEMLIDDVGEKEKGDKKGDKKGDTEAKPKAKSVKTPKYQAPPKALTSKAVAGMQERKERKAAKAVEAKAVESKESKESNAQSDEESFIGAFESDDGGADSSDDESDVDDEAIRAAGKTVQVSTLPHAKDDQAVAARLKKASKKRVGDYHPHTDTQNVERGTIYLGRVPHGFYEDEIKEYFGQFGDVTRYRLARNPKSGASRHYGYVEFSSLPVAEIVAETMHNYLLMGHLLQCVVIPQDEVHPELWAGANKKFRKVPRARVEKVRQDKPRTAEQQERADARVKRREAERREKIKAHGIEYEFEGH